MLLLLLLQVLVSCLWLGRSEVVTSFKSCPQFFFRNTPPNEALNPNNPAWICQLYKNRHYFATLYDRENRIPVYSAYLYQPAPGARPNTWLVEPQLVNRNYSKAMQTERELIKKSKVLPEQLRESQAVLEDYKNLTGMNRGHLNPNGHHNDNNSRVATFTLTNIVPQNQELNGGAWNDYETTTMISYTTNCKTTYVVVGAVPGNNYIANGRVNKPSHIWSSACCEVDANSRKAWAVIAENDKNEVSNLTLGQLEERLTQLYRRGQVSLFHRDCPRK